MFHVWGIEIIQLNPEKKNIYLSYHTNHKMLFTTAHYVQFLQQMLNILILFTLPILKKKKGDGSDDQGNADYPKQA